MFVLIMTVTTMQTVYRRITAILVHADRAMTEVATNVKVRLLYQFTMYSDSDLDISMVVRTIPAAYLYRQLVRDLSYCDLYSYTCNPVSTPLVPFEDPRQNLSLNTLSDGKDLHILNVEKLERFKSEPSTC